MKEDEKDRSQQAQDAGERDLGYGEAFGTQRDRSSTEEDGYLEPEPGDGGPQDEDVNDKVAERDLRYGDAFGTQRDRSMFEEDGYLEAEFGSREFDVPRDHEQQDNGTEEDS